MSATMDRARELLDALLIVTEVDAAPPPPGTPASRCPACGLSAGAPKRVGWKLALISLVLVGLPLIFARRRLVCTACGHVWHPDPEPEEEAIHPELMAAYEQSLREAPEGGENPERDAGGRYPEES